MSQHGKHKQGMQEEWPEQQHAELKERLACFDPTDAFGYQQINTECNILYDIGMNLHSLEVDQFTILD